LVDLVRKLMSITAVAQGATLDDIKLFPILSKKDVLAAGKSIVSNKYPKWLMRTARTGGTTGTPMELRRTLFSIGNEHAFVRRQLDWAGIGFADRCAWLVAGRRIAKSDQPDGRPYVYDPLMKELTLSVFQLSRETATVYAAAMNHYKVRGIVGISSAVYYLARMFMDMGIDAKLKAVVTTSETLTDSMRKVIAEAFDCKVFDFYGSAERVCYVFTCERGSYHVIPEYGLTELLALGGSGRGDCRIVSTGFWSLGMPLIRYDLGDVIVKTDSTCPCGREFQVVESVSGRLSEMIKTPSGRQYGPTVVAQVLKGANNILGSRIVQDSMDHISIEYVPTERFSEPDLVHFRRHASHYLPDDLKIDMRRVEDIPRTSGGKTKLIVSRI
jgi:phenylacetate-CoA ligase